MVLHSLREQKAVMWQHGGSRSDGFRPVSDQTKFDADVFNEC